MKIQVGGPSDRPFAYDDKRLAFISSAPVGEANVDNDHVCRVPATRLTTYLFRISLVENVVKVRRAGLVFKTDLRPLPNRG
jgi:hypothetical protein